MAVALPLKEEVAPVLPFLKWPGGKRWLARDVAPILSRALRGRYHEPFLGSGAMFLALQPQDAVLSDINPELIAALQVIAVQPEEVVSAVWRLSNTADCYYRVRRSSPRTEVGKAAKFLYLNRTAWGGIYRLNRHGQFNTPFGNSGRVICRRKVVLDAAQHFARVSLRCMDFEESLAQAQSGDVVYADPPYAGPTSGHESFLRYTPRRFCWRDQVRLARAAHAAVERGAAVAVSGRTDFEIEKLYPEWTTIRLSRSCRVSRSVDARSAFKEVVLLSPTFATAEARRRSTK